jgi:hypothetical protein
VRLLETTPARLDLAQALTGLGSQLRRSGRRTGARALLHRALDLSHRAGAAPLAEQARAELIAAGARPRRIALTGPDALTSAERRIAALAVKGLGNRQIAQQLFITVPTSRLTFGTSTTNLASAPGPSLFRRASREDEDYPQTAIGYRFLLPRRPDDG